MAKKITAKKKPKQVAETTKEAPRFTKAQLLASEKYRNRKDLLTALLKDGETYTMEMATNMVSAFLKGQVK